MNEILSLMVVLIFMYLGLKVMCSPLPFMVNLLKKGEKQALRVLKDVLWGINDGVGEIILGVLNHLLPPIISRSLNKRVVGIILFILLALLLLNRPPL